MVHVYFKIVTSEYEIESSIHLPEDTLTVSRQGINTRNTNFSAK